MTTTNKKLQFEVSLIVMHKRSNTVILSYMKVGICKVEKDIIGKHN